MIFAFIDLIGNDYQIITDDDNLLIRRFIFELPVHIYGIVYAMW